MIKFDCCSVYSRNWSSILRANATVLVKMMSNSIVPIVMVMVTYLVEFVNAMKDFLDWNVNVMRKIPKLKMIHCIFIWILKKFGEYLARLICIFHISVPNASTRIPWMMTWFVVIEENVNVEFVHVTKIPMEEFMDNIVNVTIFHVQK